MRRASSITVRMPRSSISRMVKTSMPARRTFSFSIESMSRTPTSTQFSGGTFGEKLRMFASSGGPNPMIAAGHAVNVTAGRAVWCVDIGVGVDPNETDLLILPAIKFCHARNSSRSHGMISAQNQRHLTCLQSFQHQVSLLGAGGGNFFQILGMGIAFFLLFGDSDGDVTRIFNDVTQLLEPRFQPGHTDSRGAHVNPAPRLAEIKRHPNDTDLLGGNIRGGDVSSHRFNH